MQKRGQHAPTSFQIILISRYLPLFAAIFFPLRRTVKGMQIAARNYVSLCKSRDKRTVVETCKAHFFVSKLTSRWC